MKVFLYLLPLLVSIKATSVKEDFGYNITYLLSLRPEDIQNFQPKIRASDSNVKIYFRSKTISALGVEVDLTNPSSLTSTTDFSASKNSIFIIHGWMNSHLTITSVEISEAYLKTEDVNLFVVDWSSIAFFDYLTAQLNVEDIGHIVGKLISDLVSGTGVSTSKVAIVGHSLGAHIAGIAAKTAGGKLSYIVGLDPAGPLFSMANSNNRIDSSDAKFVQIIHTCAGYLGFDGELGHADYWPNGGHDQPGCILDTTGLCRHSRSFDYFSESLLSGNFISKSCDSYEKYKQGNCGSGGTSWMGQINIDTLASGNYWLETNDAYPYARGS